MHHERGVQASAEKPRRTCVRTWCEKRARVGARVRLFLAVLLGCTLLPGAALAADGPSATLAERDGAPVFRVGGKPFFVYGAAFFYERLPRDAWAPALLALRDRLHVNTLDLYVPWNWHELADGDFDFDGRTNPRRDLREVLRLAHAFGFKLVVRPGPVVRNEWRNGGYPAWLLERPEYGMPLRDVLEGRYPATATLQNARSDDAAADWMRNATHLRYAKRWLERVGREIAPVSGDVLAIALDDDQGAYIDNQTWPAPHLRAYLEWLRDVVRGATDARVPVFINTYEMKVTASSPVWAMGNWYQSDAYAIGDHDRSQLEFSTGLLQTRPHQPLMMSEFQAGWLEQPQDVLPQAADPSNTLLALHTLLGAGVRGIINFPAQDTYDPAGWEAPFANGFYAWDAAFSYDGTPSARAAPTALVGRMISTFGPSLAAARVRPDAAIAYLTSAYDPRRLDGRTVSAIVDATIEAQRGCRRAGLTCPLVDLRFTSGAALHRYRALVVPRVAVAGGTFVPAVEAVLRAYVRRGGIVTADANARAFAGAFARRRPVVTDLGAATYAQAPSGGAGFVTLENYDDVARSYPHATVRRDDGTILRLPPIEVAARDALLLPVDVPLRAYGRFFAPGDVLQSSSCPVIAIAAATNARELRVERKLSTTGVACTTRFALAAARKSHIVSFVSHDAAFAIDSAGAVAPERTADAPETHAPIAPPAPANALPVRNDLLVEGPAPRATGDAALAYVVDAYRDGYPCVVLENDVVRVVVSPASGGRAFVFEDKLRHRNAFDTIGALRDDVVTQPPPSQTDRIAKYTHQFPAGFFNRPYAATIESSGTRATVRFHYDAPDAFPYGAAFDRTIELAPHARTFTVAASATFAGVDDLARAQRGVLISSLAAGDPRGAATILRLPSGDPLAPDAPQATASPAAEGADAAGLFDPVSHDLVMQAWVRTASPGDASGVRGYAHQLTTAVALSATGSTRVAFAFETAPSLDAARSRLNAFRCELESAAGTLAAFPTDCRPRAAAGLR